SQPLVVPLDSPCRTDASQELLRTEPFQVKLSEWLCPTLFETRKIVADVVGLNGTSVSVPGVPMPPGSPELSVPELRATFGLPVRGGMRQHEHECHSDGEAGATFRAAGGRLHDSPSRAHGSARDYGFCRPL